MTAPADVGAALMAAAERSYTLYSLETQALELMALLDDADTAPEDQREINPQLAEDHLARLALIDQMLMDKTEGYVSVIRTLEKMAEARKAEADRLRDRAKTAERHADWLKERLLSHMKVMGQDRIETVRFTLSVRANPGRVEVTDAALVPSEYQRTVITTTVNKTAVMDVYKRDGLVVPGTEVVKSDRLAIS